eukprot:m.113647 g.113647  ORF g.113647 m.113647 type:complete len:215 (+) comp17092_c0_seq3:1636-2280(+)
MVAVLRLIVFLIPQTFSSEFGFACFFILRALQKVRADSMESDVSDWNSSPVDARRGTAQKLDASLLHATACRGSKAYGWTEYCCSGARATHVDGNNPHCLSSLLHARIVIYSARMRLGPGDDGMSRHTGLSAVASAPSPLARSRKGQNQTGKARRVRRPWTEEQVDALKQGVKEFGVGQWRQIAERYFDKSTIKSGRDLKDKWRNLKLAKKTED